jgi:hypothetical protein
MPLLLILLILPVNLWNCAGLLANVDALEDDAKAYHWCWELRALTGLPKTVKQAADTARKRRKQVRTRLDAAA